MARFFTPKLTDYGSRKASTPFTPETPNGVTVLLEYSNSSIFIYWSWSKVPPKEGNITPTSNTSPQAERPSVNRVGKIANTRNAYLSVKLVEQTVARG
jgi:hypothetical protein